MEVIAITDKFSAPRKETATDRKAKSQDGKKTRSLGQAVAAATPDTDKQTTIEFEIGDIERAILAKVVQKCGNRLYWDEWAKDIARIASTHITRLTTILNNPGNTEEVIAFDSFLADLHADLNASISREEAIEMLAQHIITRPVFDALFEGYSFADHNPVSEAMQEVLAVLEKHHLEKETETLTRMYGSVRRRAADTKTLAGKQKLILELYEKFFRNAFPKMAERLGIVYTPVEVVDFILNSVNDVLKSNFGQTMGSSKVHIIDPFTGTGTFITRLLQGGLIEADQLEYKYRNEIHANEIVLLAYYIATINIEQAFHNLTKKEYVPFSGICLTDTFNLPTGVKEWHDEPTRDNSARLKRQRELDIRVIIGNPPYSSGESTPYPALDKRIRDTYAASSGITMVRALYDSYVRAIRWASDRIGDSGVIGFVSNASFIDGNAMDGLRQCLGAEFSSIYIFHLRGNARTAGELRKQERDNVFAQGTRAPIAISILVKNPAAKSMGDIWFHDVGDYLTREQKLDRLVEFAGVAGVTQAHGWREITPSVRGDWVKQGTDDFNSFIEAGNKKSKDSLKIFCDYSNGVKTGRDAWCYNSSRASLQSNVKKTIAFYNSEMIRIGGGAGEGKKGHVKDLVRTDYSKIVWSDDLYVKLKNSVSLSLVEESIVPSLYRPFSKRWMYKRSDLNWSLYRMNHLFPGGDLSNLAIAVVAPGSRQRFTALMVDTIVDLHFSPDGAQCFPRYLYEVEATTPTKQQGLFVEDGDGENATNSVDPVQFQRKEAISAESMAHFASTYPGQSISKDDLFFYVYGVLHSNDYISRYADNLTKTLPRIPAVATFADFLAFSQAGRALSALHVGYETVEPYPVKLALSKPREEFAAIDYRVTQMRFAKGSGGIKHDKSRVVYNHNVLIQDIPLSAYDYVVNGKPALEWVMERQAVTTHKESGIVNDANSWAVETMGHPAYPLELFQRVITVSLETMKIVKGLPSLEL